jgi:hypothetical protein
MNTEALPAAEPATRRARTTFTRLSAALAACSQRRDLAAPARDDTLDLFAMLEPAAAEAAKPALE